ncbi:MAG: helix-turn-helix domain-containing protein [Candidatus Sulfotelmatobacter sp.]
MVQYPTVIDRGEINKRFGRRLAQCRKRSGLSQEKLAKALRLTRTSITNIEHGRQPIQLSTLYAIAEALSLEPTDLMPGLPKAVGETSVDRKQLKGLSVRATNWIAKVSGELPTERVETRNGSKSQEGS